MRPAFLPVVAFTLLLLFIFTSDCISDNSAKAVLVLLPGQPGAPATVDFLLGLRKTLFKDQASAVDVYSEHLNLQQFPFPEYESKLIDWLRTKYSKTKLGVLVTATGDSFRFAEKWRDTLWPGTPVVYSVLDETGRKEFPPNFTGINFPQDYVGTVKAALQLQPETRYLALISGASKVDLLNREYVLEQLKSLKNRIEIIEIYGLPISETEKRLSKLPENTIVLVSSYIVDGSGKILFGPELLARFIAASNSPMYEVNRLSMGSGVVGGKLADYEEAGVETAQVVLRILNGESASKIPVQTTESAKLIFDWRQLQRWSLDESTLPEGSTVMFRPPSFWEQYKWPISAAIALIIFQTMLISTLLAQRLRTKKAEDAEMSAKLETQQHRLEIAHVTRAATMGELASSVAHELNQPLTAILSNAQAAKRFLAKGASDPSEIQDILSDIATEDIRAREIINRMRALLKKEEHLLEPVKLNDVVDTVLHVVKDELLVKRVDVKKELSEDIKPIQADPVQLQQVLLNLLLNARDAVSDKHDGERKIILKTWTNGSEVNLSVQDTGKGIDAETLDRIFEPFFSTKREGLGMGLTISKTIMQAHEGKIWAESKPAQGTIFYCSFPY